MKSSAKRWYINLMAARRVADSNDGIVTSSALALAAKISVRFASAWLSKFERWGYVKRVEGRGTPKRGRPSVLWELTTYGSSRKAPGRSNQPSSSVKLRIAANPKEDRE
jgi:predicted ArsR family transcriptional regulator